MAYRHYLIERPFIKNATGGANLTGGSTTFLGSGTGEKGRIFFGHKCIIRRVTLGMYASSTTAKPVISLRLASKAGQASATGQQIRTMTVPATKAAGSVVRTSQMNSVAKSGTELVCDVITAATKALRFRINALVEPNFDLGANESGPTVNTVTG